MLNRNNTRYQTPVEKAAAKRAQRLNQLDAPLFLWTTMGRLDQVSEAGFGTAPAPEKDTYHLLITRRRTQSPLVLMAYPTGEPRNIVEFEGISDWLLHSQFSDNVRLKYGLPPVRRWDIDWVQLRQGGFWYYRCTPTGISSESLDQVPAIGGFAGLQSILTASTGRTPAEQQRILPPAWWSIYLTAGLVSLDDRSVITHAKTEQNTAWCF